MKKLLCQIMLLLPTGLSFVQAQTNPMNFNPTAPAYSAGTTYQARDVAIYNGIGYVSLQSNNLGNTPASSSSYWVALGSTGVGSPAGANLQFQINNGSAFGATNFKTDSTFSDILGARNVGFTGTLAGNTTYSQTAQQLLTAQGGGLVPSQGHTLTSIFTGQGLLALPNAVNNGSSTSSALTISGRFYTPGQNSSFDVETDCFAAGDCHGGDNYITGFGGAFQEDSEGIHSPNWYPSENAVEPLITCVNSSCTQVSGDNYNGVGTAGHVGVQQWVRDTSDTTTTTVVGGGEDVLPIAVFGSTPWTRSTMAVIASNVVLPPVQATPGTVTVSIGTAPNANFVSMGSGFVPGPACVVNDAGQIYDSFEIAQIVSSTATTVTVTFEYAHPPNFYLSQGGACGFGADETAETNSNANHLPMMFHLFGSIDATHVYYGDAQNAFLGISTNAGVSTHWTPTSNGASIYPIAQVQANDLNGNMMFFPNSVPFATGKVLASANGRYPQLNGDYTLITGVTPLRSGPVGSIREFRGSASTTLNAGGYETINDNPFSTYQAGFPGLFGFRTVGAHYNGFVMVEAPAGGSVVSVQGNSQCQPGANPALISGCTINWLQDVNSGATVQQVKGAGNDRGTWSANAPWTFNGGLSVFMPGTSGTVPIVAANGSAGTTLLSNGNTGFWSRLDLGAGTAANSAIFSSLTGGILRENANGVADFRGGGLEGIGLTGPAGGTHSLFWLGTVGTDANVNSGEMCGTLFPGGGPYNQSAPATVCSPNILNFGLHGASANLATGAMYVTAPAMGDSSNAVPTTAWVTAAIAATSGGGSSTTQARTITLPSGSGITSATVSVPGTYSTAQLCQSQDQTNLALSRCTVAAVPGGLTLTISGTAGDTLSWILTGKTQ